MGYEQAKGDSSPSLVRPSPESLHDVYEWPAKLLGIKHFRVIQIRVVEHLQSVLAPRELDLRVLLAR
ncbi:hypothetical protein VTO73DRAFT_10195 [Trametes versicolor]